MTSSYGLAWNKKNILANNLRSSMVMKFDKFM